MHFVPPTAMMIISCGALALTTGVVWKRRMKAMKPRQIAIEIAASASIAALRPALITSGS